MLEKLGTRGFEQGPILHVAESLFHDHGPRSRSGLANCGSTATTHGGGFGATFRPMKCRSTDFRFTSLAEMAEAHRRETG